MGFYSLCELVQFFTLLNLSLLTEKLGLFYLSHRVIFEIFRKANCQCVTSSVTFSKY